MQRILHIARYYAPHMGGVESHLTQLNQRLIDRGYQVSVLTSQHDPGLSLSETTAGVVVYRLPVVAALNKTIYKLQLWTEVVRHSQLLIKADIIHVHDVMWWLLPLWPLIFHKTYATFHGWEGIFPVPWQNKLLRWVWSKMARRRIHVGSYIQKFYLDKPDTVIFGAVDRELIYSPVSNKKSRKTTCVFLGRLVSENEIDKYIQLIKILNRRIPSSEMVWLGDGPYKAACANVGKALGFVTDIARYLDQADVVFASSYLSILQAQSRGKIVSAFYSHALKEASLTTFPTASSMLIESDVNTMARQIETLLADRDLKIAHEKKAKAWADTQTWDRIADTYEQLWGTYG